MIPAFPIEVDEVKIPLQMFSLTIWRWLPDAKPEAGTEFERAHLRFIIYLHQILYPYH